MNQFEWDTAADLPDDLPDAVCEICGNEYARCQAILMDGRCECGGQLIPDTGDAQ
jgi:hypothetical protein